MFFLSNESKNIFFILKRSSCDPHSHAPVQEYVVAKKKTIDRLMKRSGKEVKRNLAFYSYLSMVSEWSAIPIGIPIVSFIVKIMEMSNKS